MGSGGEAVNILHAAWHHRADIEQAERNLANVLNEGPNISHTQQTRKDTADSALLFTVVVLGLLALYF